MSVISTTFSRVSPVYHIHSFDVGYVLEVNGFSNSDPEEWKTVRVATTTDAELQALISEVNQLPKAQ